MLNNLTSSLSRLTALAAIALLAALTGCAGLPPGPEREVTQSARRAADTVLGGHAQRVALDAGESGFQGLPQAEYALDARVELIRRAQRAIDLQTYQIAPDGVGRTMLKELRDAARRGVRVRLLVDDFYTLGLDAALLQLAAHDGVSVRLYNPFVYGRDSASGRFWNLLTDGRRLNHRMHNKLLLVDGAMAIVGGRNLTDDYFSRSAAGNFLDFDFLIVGAIVPELGDMFDRYWNHRRVVDIRRLSDDGRSAEQRRAAFDAFAALAPPYRPPGARDMLGFLPLGQALAAGEARFRAARARAFADDPDKTFDPAAPRDLVQPNTTLAWIESQTEPKQEAIVISPYFLPDQRVRQRLTEAARLGVRITVLSNSVASSDEPLVAFASHSGRTELLAAGVRLKEVMPHPVMHTPFTLNMPPGAAVRLHAKMGIFDRRTVGVGSINLDPRSHRINTEMAMMVDSPELAGEMAQALLAWMQTDGVHEVVRGESGWRFRTRHGDRVVETDQEPGLDWWTRLRLRLVYMLVPDELL
ncbi:MAG: hypothetical protein RJA10_2501 [Pseudomonadota bacterium]|jgi:cardiolipin synthase C